MNNDIYEGSFYRGNTNLKRAGTKTEYTPDMIAEWIKCKNDPIYFIEKYVKIINIDDGFVPISLYDYQKKIIESFNNYRNSQILSSRQSGKSTTLSCIILHYIIFNKDKRVGILANKADSAREILDRIRLAYEALPMWIQHGVIEFNKGKLTLENKSQVLAAATSSSSIRGKSLNVLVLDETAHIENFHDFYQSTYPTISSGKESKVVMISTPNGLNHYYDFWVGANRDQTSEEWNGFNPIKVGWEEVPGRDEKWRATTLAALGFDQQKFAQEFDCDFIGSSTTLISGGRLKSLAPKIPSFNDFDGLLQYEAPIKDRQYVLIADVSRGKGLDYSAFQVIDVSQVPYQQVCVYRNNMMLTSDYAETIYRIAVAYNNAYVLVENNDIGAEVPNILHNEYEYENILWTENKGRSGKQICFGGKSAEKGIRTTVSVKAVGCSMLKMLVEQLQLEINDKETIHELGTFVRTRNSYEAETGKHDDLVMPLVLFGWLTAQPMFKELTNQDIMKVLRERSNEELDRDLIPFGFIADGREDPVEQDFDTWFNS